MIPSLFPSLQTGIYGTIEAVRGQGLAIRTTNHKVPRHRVGQCGGRNRLTIIRLKNRRHALVQETREKRPGRPG